MKFLLTFLFIATCLSAQPQTIYRLKYKSPVAGDTTIYDTYFSISPDGTGFVRVRSADGKSITEMGITEQYATDANGIPDTTMLVYEGTDPVVVKGNKKTPFPPHSFWFKINTQNLFDPWGVTTQPAGPAPVEINFLSAAFINDIAKKKDTVLRFFADTSRYYNKMFGPASKGNGSLPRDVRSKTKLRLIIVASTKDPHLKNTAIIDAGKIKTIFSDITKVLGIGFLLDTIYGDKYSRFAVENSLKKLTPGKNDIVVFYYTGHGFTDKAYTEKEYPFPFLDLRDPSKQMNLRDIRPQAMNIKDIYDIIVTKGARLNLVLSDCCNDSIAALKNLGLPETKKKGAVTYRFENVRALFMSTTPMNYLMTAASRDERATITPSYNSYFTNFFIASLNTYLSEDKEVLHWNRVLADVLTQTKLFAGKVPCPRDSPCPNGKTLSQTPKWHRPKL